MSFFQDDPAPPKKTTYSQENSANGRKQSVGPCLQDEILRDFYVTVLPIIDFR
jgi:hypothetical protein